jgi:hypothetical protein
MEQPRTGTSTTAMVATALLAGAVGFGLGFEVGRHYGDHAGQIPCPPCKILENNVRGENGALKTSCTLVGKIDDGWGGGEITVQWPTAMHPSDDRTFGRTECFSVELASCPENGSDVWFNQGGVPVINPLCFGADCPKVVGCEP